MSRQIVEIETKTFVRFWLVILGFAVATFFVVRASEALAIIGIAILFAIAIRPLAMKVDKFIGKKNQSTLASVLAYLIVLLVIAAVVAVISPVIINEFSKFLSSFPEIVKSSDMTALNEIGRTFGIENFSAEIIHSIEDLSKNFLSIFGTGVVSGISTVSSILAKAGITLVITLFLLLDGPSIMESVWSKLGAKRALNDLKDEKDSEVKVATEARVITTKMAKVISTFVGKQVSIAIIDGLASGISVFILCLIFKESATLAVPMGMIMMTFYLIPMFGQVIGASLVTLILLFNNPLMAVIWLAFYIVYGFVEVNVFAPKIQGEALKLKPVVILISITIGTYMFGLFGAIIAIPIAGCIKVLVDEYPTIRKLRK